MISGHPIFTGFRGLTSYQRDPRDRGVIIYSSHNSNIKCINSTTKYIDFESFHYVIKLDVVSSFIVFSRFNFMFLSMYY